MTSYFNKKAAKSAAVVGITAGIAIGGLVAITGGPVATIAVPFTMAAALFHYGGYCIGANDAEKKPQSTETPTTAAP
ncbi:hypothetical protein [Martelella mediterranea]|uniref:Uncharacterized protein n=1 Tax=Martelella mediterranea DSM 17316 TaxID=1122214 RepID=A0A1U9YZK4_9HYPH|nr:hypothetical protein [Martelella mediterranea]AQZ50869.1 hypothetical protein Mame_01516 [Martelella mediterranea DSM 17316]